MAEKSVLDFRYALSRAVVQCTEDAAAPGFQASTHMYRNALAAPQGGPIPEHIPCVLMWHHIELTQNWVAMTGLCRGSRGSADDLAALAKKPMKRRQLLFT